MPPIIAIKGGGVEGARQAAWQNIRRLGRCRSVRAALQTVQRKKAKAPRPTAYEGSACSAQVLPCWRNGAGSGRRKLRPIRLVTSRLVAPACVALEAAAVQVRETVEICVGALRCARYHVYALLLITAAPLMPGVCAERAVR